MNNNSLKTIETSSHTFFLVPNFFFNTLCKSKYRESLSCQKCENFDLPKQNLIQIYTSLEKHANLDSQILSSRVLYNSQNTLSNLSPPPSTFRLAYGNLIISKVCGRCHVTCGQETLRTLGCLKVCWHMIIIYFEYKMIVNL